MNILIQFYQLRKLYGDWLVDKAIMWLKAMIWADENVSTEQKKSFEQLVVFDPEIKDEKDDEKEIKYLLEELQKVRTKNK